MAAADTNVRPTLRLAAATARGARRSVLARLLLHLFGPLQLHRKLLLFLALPLMPACIIPVGPEFSDPDGTPNAPPRITDADPFFGEQVTALGSQTFQITITDPNVVDHLYVKWIADYPPFDGNTRQIPAMMYPPPGDGQPIQMPVDLKIVCDLLSRNPSQHRIMAVVADRPFVDTEPGNPLAIEASGQFDAANWFLTLTSCQLQ
jgi:hypothetical protein